MRLKFISSIVLLVVVVLGSSNTYAQRFGGGINISGCISKKAQDLTEQEKQALLYMWEEEKLARDVYLALNEQWDLNVFKNIAKSEAVHMDAVARLIKKYKLNDGSNKDYPGIFRNKELQKLYYDLIKKGETSVKNALTIGATIEDLDIFDLKKRMAATDNEDILCVFKALTKGSENHMRAFVRMMKLYNVTYQAQYISQAELEHIVSQEMNRGRGGGRGKGMRRF